MEAFRGVFRGDGVYGRKAFQSCFTGQPVADGLMVTFFANDVDGNLLFNEERVLAPAEVATKLAVTGEGAIEYRFDAAASVLLKRA